jgi:hypothetical protein
LNLKLLLYNITCMKPRLSLAPSGMMLSKVIYFSDFLWVGDLP